MADFQQFAAHHLTMWDDQVAALKDSFRILRYDQRGHGGRPKAVRPTFDLLAADVIGLMDALGIKRAHFVGISMGGMTALLLAEKYRDRFDRIIPCDCGAARRRGRAAMGGAHRACRQGHGGTGRVTIPRWFPPEFVATKPPVLDKVRGMIATRRSKASPVARRRCRITTAAAVGIANPTLLIVGTKDATVGGMQGIKSRARVESGRTRRGRSPFQPGATAEFSQSIREFIKAADGS